MPKWLLFFRSRAGVSFLLAPLARVASRCLRSSGRSNPQDFSRVGPDSVEPAAASNPVKLSAVDAIIQQAIADNNIPGAVLVVGHDGKVIYRKAYGHRSLEPKREAMTLDTIFDLASLTKVIATTTAVMQLMEQGKVRMNDPVAKYIPEFAQNGKDDITIRQLLTHYSGLAADLDLKTAWEGKQTAYQLAFVMRHGNDSGFGLCLQRYQLHHAGCACREGLGRDARRLHGATHLYPAENDAYAVCASGGVAGEDCAHAVRRERKDAARRGARSHGAAYGRRGRACWAVFDRG